MVANLLPINLKKVENKDKVYKDKIYKNEDYGIHLCRLIVFNFGTYHDVDDVERRSKGQFDQMHYLNNT